MVYCQFGKKIKFHLAVETPEDIDTDIEEEEENTCPLCPVPEAIIEMCKKIQSV